MNSPYNIQQPPATPLTTRDPHDNDVLCGRGGTINAWPGNEQYRSFVERKKRVYLTARFKREKRLISQSIIDEVRNLNPPGRFLAKDQVTDIWADIGDDKAREKTSQALRENAIGVRKKMEEENEEIRRQQARELAIATGRCPDEAVEFMKNVQLAASNSAGSGDGSPSAVTSDVAPTKNESKKGQKDTTQQKISAAKKTQPQQKQPSTQLAHQSPVPAYQPPVAHQHQQQHQAPPTIWGGAQNYQQDQQPQIGAAQGHVLQQQSGLQSVQQPQILYQSVQINMQQNLNQGIQQQQGQGGIQQQQGQGFQQVPNDQYAKFLEWQNKQDKKRHHGGRQTVITQPLLHPPQNSLATGQQQQAGQLQQHAQALAQPGLRPSTRSSSLGNSRNSSLSNSSRDNSPGEGRHVQFQSDIPLVIDSSQRSSTKIQPRVTQQYPPQQYQQHQQQELSVSSTPHASISEMSPQLSPRSQANFSQAMSQATPLTFLSTDMSVKTADSLNYYLQGLEDEISGDVGQEVELVAHAPMLDDNMGHHPHHPHQRHQHHGGIPAYSRSTPPRYGGRGSVSGSSHKSGSSGRKKKRRSGNYIPSNSGKVQLDLSNLGGPSSTGAPTFFGAPTQQAQVQTPAPTQHAQAQTPAAGGGKLPCDPVNVAAASCGGILPTPVRKSNATGPNRSPPTSGSMGPPLNAAFSPTGGSLGGNSLQHMSSPGSLDLDKMSLCGTENISHAGGSLGGASLCNVFDDHDDSVIGANALMDMTMSLGSGQASHPSSDGSRNNALGQQAMGLQNIQPIGMHQFGNDDESLIGGASALMDMSVGSGGAQSKHSSSGGSGSNGSRRSGSPASVDKVNPQLNKSMMEIHQQFQNDGPQGTPQGRNDNFNKRRSYQSEDSG